MHSAEIVTVIGRPPRVFLTRKLLPNSGFPYPHNPDNQPSQHTKAGHGILKLSRSVSLESFKRVFLMILFV